MERLRDNEKKTILLSTHILQEVEAMASRVILINEGRLVYDGPVADLIHDKGGLDGAFKRLTAAEAALV
jgi:ABC-2 type transport system ATP-binding protein